MIDVAGRTFGAAQRLADRGGGARGATLGQKVPRAAKLVNRLPHGVAVCPPRGSDGAHGIGPFEIDQDAGDAGTVSMRTSMAFRPMVAENWRPSGTNHWAR